MLKIPIRLVFCNNVHDSSLYHELKLSGSPRIFISESCFHFNNQENV